MKRHAEKDYVREEKTQYLSLVNEILAHGNKRDDRTKTGTMSLFGKMMKVFCHC